MGCVGAAHLGRPASGRPSRRGLTSACGGGPHLVKTPLSTCGELLASRDTYPDDSLLDGIGEGTTVSPPRSLRPSLRGTRVTSQRGGRGPLVGASFDRLHRRDRPTLCSDLIARLAARDETAGPSTSQVFVTASRCHATASIELWTASRVRGTVKRVPPSREAPGDALIKRGLIDNPLLGYAAFTVPQFDDYLRRKFPLEQHSAKRRQG